MDLDADQNQSNSQISSEPTTMVRTPTDEVAPEPKTKKLTGVSSAGFRLGCCFDTESAAPDESMADRLPFIRGKTSESHPCSP
ncbi:hypothetical protein M407DRAFT_243740 [Tulasnella calospora MUT 4182]|uniref:Uncharacterized protein n=1 Tax=Tulasnella calospora MUT 4182 TaxID=1051891 RepID=A0A0C3LY57_9AGAM|nr:hypothetical protein M407DRAFT_243740 [Tulasnella calospora MUT 4182]